MSSKDGDDEFIGYEIPIVTGEYEESESSGKNKSQVFNLESFDVNPQHTRFEMMEVHITLYTLSGILYTKTKASYKRRRRSQKPGIWRKGSRSSKSSTTSDGITTTGTSTQGATLSTLSESYTQLEMVGFEMNPLLAPTTAVVSSTRYNAESDRPMETFMPSLPLHRLSRGDRHSLRYSARWSGDSSSRSIDGEEESCPSFKILRLMNQQQYNPTSNIREVSTYEHEQIDLCVFVGRGKQLVPIGVVAFVVTGDEETETILNLPVKKPVPGSLVYERHFKRSSRSKGPKDSFEDDPNNIFTIGNNASLRLGVRVFPQRSFLEADERSTVGREQDEKVFESVLQRILDTDLLSDLNDENSLVQRIVESQRKKIEEERHQAVQKLLIDESHHQQQDEHEKRQQIYSHHVEDSPTPHAALKTDMFCNFGFFQSQMCTGPTTPDVPQQVVTVNRRNQFMDMQGDGDNTLPLTLVSSVSESVTTVGGHSNIRFRDEWANM